MMTAGPAVLKNSLRCVLLGIDTLAPSAIFGERSPPYIQRGFALTLWRGSPPRFSTLPALPRAQGAGSAKKRAASPNPPPRSTENLVHPPAFLPPQKTNKP